MKSSEKIYIALALFTAISGGVYAQGAFVTLGAGYNLAAGSQVVGTNATASNVEMVKGSFGKGVSFGLAFGYLFGENVGAEVGVSYLSGSKYKLTDNDGTFNSVEEVKGKMIRIAPALRVTGGEEIKPYAKFGVVIGVGTKVESKVTGGGFGSTFTGEDIYSGGSSIGWLGAFGAEFELSDMLGIYVELNNITQSWSPEKDEWKLTVSSGTTSENTSGTINFEDNVPVPNTNQNLGLKDYAPFSSFGIHVGVKLSFGGN